MKLIFRIAVFFFFISSLSGQESSDTLKVAFTSAPPFIINNGDEPEGINVWLWDQVAEDLNLNYELVPMGFADMLDALKDGTIDLSINPLTITSERSKSMDFTRSYYASNSTVVIYESSSFQKLTQFFNSIFNLNFIKGFLALLFIIFLFGLGIWLTERRVNHIQFRPGIKGLWDGLWWSVVTMTTVGYGDKSPKTRGGKMIALIWMFSGLLFISGLTASVASMLTINQLKSNPEGFNEFKEQTVGSINNSSAFEFLEERFFKDVRPYNGVVPGLDALNKGEIDAFLYDEPILKYRLKKNIEYENLKILPIKFDLQFYAFGMPAILEAFSEDQGFICPP